MNNNNNLVNRLRAITPFQPNLIRSEKYVKGKRILSNMNQIDNWKITADGEPLTESYDLIAQQINPVTGENIPPTYSLLKSNGGGVTGVAGPTGFTGPVGPTGSIAIKGTGTGSILLKGNDGIYYSEILKINNEEINISSNMIPTDNNTYTLGAIGLRWKEIFMGPGSLNISGPTGFIDATIGSNLAGIAYSQFGFVTPFLNIGPNIDPLSPVGTIGGWNIRGIGPTGGNFTDLVAQLIDGTTGAGFTGQIYSLIKGQSGITGPDGNTGPGFTGPTGLGATGLTGPTGFTGPGFTGPTGVGTTGSTGVNIFTEYTLRGITGSFTVSSPYFDYYLIDTTSEPCDITLPAISSLTNNKRTFTFTDIGGSLTTNQATINTTNPDLVGGELSFTLNTDYASTTLTSNAFIGPTGIWCIT